MDVVRFYDELAVDYHLIYADWRKSVARQGAVLDRLIGSYLGAGARAVLDCTCGIGTQAIGLAARGHRVHATDVSSVAVERAAREAKTFGVEMTTGVADVRALEREVEGTFEVVLSCDNSLPHLIDDADLAAAARGMRAKLARGGLVIASIRDYDRLATERPRAEPPRVLDDPRRVVFQVWDWAPDGRTYTVGQFIMRRAGDAWDVTHVEARYRALQCEELASVLAAGGFEGVRWHTEDETGFFQPIVTARAR